MANAEKLWDRLAARMGQADGSRDAGQRGDREDEAAPSCRRPGARLRLRGRLCGYPAGPSVGSVHGVDVSSNMIAAAKRREAAQKRRQRDVRPGDDIRLRAR